MKGQPAVIDLLNEVLTGELTSVNQYFLHAKMCESWGYQRLHEKIYKESIDEMKHSSRLVERVLFLEGLPNLQRYWKINVGQDVGEMLKLDHQNESKHVDLLNNAIKACRDAGDNGSRELLERILVDSEEHVDWLEAQLHVVGEIGLANYLAQQIREDK